jgi:hypothetical protein
MTKLELERRVAEIEAKGGDDAPHRIQTLRDHYERQQVQQAAEREREQQRAEAELKDNLKRAYLKSSPAATAEGFEADYPELRRQKLVGEALKAEREASRQQGAAMREAF